MTLPKELKEAISNLSSTEKDKLIFRLLKKDLMLANRLLFELVSEQTVDERRENVQKTLEFEIKRATQNFYSPGYLLMDVRYMSGIITEHVTITKDKFGEAWLNLWMLNQVLERNQKNLLTAKSKHDQKFYIAVVARVFKILLIIQKLHEDFLTEFSDDLKKLSNLIGDNHTMMTTAIHHGLDVNWLFFAKIPENIVEIHKELRENGFLK